MGQSREEKMKPWGVDQQHGTRGVVPEHPVEAADRAQQRSEVPKKADADDRATGGLLDEVTAGLVLKVAAKATEPHALVSPEDLPHQAGGVGVP